MNKSLELELPQRLGNFLGGMTGKKKDFVILTSLVNSETGVTCRPGGSELGMAGQRLLHYMRASSAYTICMHAC